MTRCTAQARLYPKPACMNAIRPVATAGPRTCWGTGFRRRPRTAPEAGGNWQPRPRSANNRSWRLSGSPGARTGAQPCAPAGSARGPGKWTGSKFRHRAPGLLSDEAGFSMTPPGARIRGRRERQGWVAVPPHLADRYRQAKQYADSGSPTLEQLALPRLLATASTPQAACELAAAANAQRDQSVSR